MPRHDKGKGKGKAVDIPKDWGYMRLPAIQSYYNELTKDSLENAVDALWDNILHLYFTALDGYGIDPQANTEGHPKNKKKADFAVRFVHNGIPRKIILVENKRVSEETSNTTWSKALKQLSQYMYEARAANPSPDHTMYGIVTVGHYSRFYVLYSHEDELSDYRSGVADYHGQPLEFKDDEWFVHLILQELVQVTSQGY
ncbi:hypothetical protein IL306_012988 [Fusarium sp. DS 682]|nr:hypothetical protein IL306_012988 [Fusarium sp. DS 682]